jgi:hypothetical protein
MKYEVYLSTSGGAWCVIHQGLPLCAAGSRESADIVARHYGYKPETLPVWDGDSGSFVEPLRRVVVGGFSHEHWCPKIKGKNCQCVPKRIAE